MVAETTLGWRDVKAEWVRRNVTGLEVAEHLGLKYHRLTILMASEDVTLPRPEFAERLIRAAEEIAQGRAH